MPEVDIRKQLNLKPIADYSKYVNSCWYGEWGSGKTYLAATAEDVKEMSPVLHLSFEQGLLTVAYRKGYDGREIRTIEQLEAVVKILQNGGAGHYKTLIMDNATEMQNLDINQIMHDAHENATDKSKINIDVPSKREWGILKSRVRRCVHEIRDLPMHTIWTAWEGAETDDDGNVIKIFPKLAGSIKAEFGGYFDIVGYYTNQLTMRGNETEVVRKLQVQGTEKVKAKWRNRPEDIPGILVNPTMQDIYDGWKKSRVVTEK